MTDSSALLRRLTRFRVDYSRRAYSLDAGDIEIVLGMGKRIEVLEAMLAWYANPKNWDDGDNSSPTDHDCGWRARQALGLLSPDLDRAKEEGP